MKIGPVGAAFFHADGRTDEQTDGKTEGQSAESHDKANSRFSQFC